MIEFTNRNADREFISIFNNVEVEIIKIHSKQFLEPILIMMDLSTRPISQSELFNSVDYKCAIEELKEIKKQRYEEVFLKFANFLINNV